MPWIVPFIPLIAAGATAGVGIGSIVSSDNNTASNQAAQKAQLTQEQQAQANQANLSKQEAVLGAQGQSQAQTGGSLTDSGTAALTDLLAGYPGYQSGSTGSTSGGAGPSSASAITPTSLGSGGGAGGNDPSSAVTAILAALRNGGAGGLGGSGGPGTGSISGGNWQSQPPQPQPWQELSNPVLG